MNQLTEVFYSLCILSVFIIIGKILRVKLRIFQVLFLPSSIIAGFIALSMGPSGFDILPKFVLTIWSQVPGILINIVFASLFLGVVLPKPKEIWTYGGPQICFGSVLGFGQYFFALSITAILLKPLFNVSEIFGCIVEVGFSGGHGTAAGMTKTFKNLGFEAGGALSQMSATIGILFSVILGIVLINIAIRKGYCTCLNEKKGIPSYKKRGLIPEPKRYSIATATVSTEAIEPLTFHFAIISIAILFGWLMLFGLEHINEFFKGFPLFPLAMIGGLIVQGVSTKLKVAQYYDKDTFDRILGFSLDVLVLSAIASIKLDLFYENLWPFIILMIGGITWTVFAAMIIAPRMFPEYWFERSVTEFGMQMGVTAMGLLLLRIVDPLYKTDTATAFGFKQIVYEPFLGGGLITVMAPYFIIKFGMLSGILVTFVLMIIFILISFFNGWIRLKPDLKAKDLSE